MLKNVEIINDPPATPALEPGGVRDSVCRGEHGGKLWNIGWGSALFSEPAGVSVRNSIFSTGEL